MYKGKFSYSHKKKEKKVACSWRNAMFRNQKQELRILVPPHLNNRVKEAKRSKKKKKKWVNYIQRMRTKEDFNKSVMPGGGFK